MLPSVVYAAWLVGVCGSIAVAAVEMRKPGLWAISTARVMLNEGLEFHHIAVLNDVLFAFSAQLANRASGGEAAQFH